MKKKILLITLLGISIGLHSQQLSRGSSLISGGVGFSQNKSTAESESFSSFSGSQKTRYTSTSSTLSFLGDYGYFVSDNFAVGVGVSFSQYDTKTEYDSDNVGFPYNDTETNTLGYYGRLFTRYYIPLGQKLFFFPEFNVLYGVDITTNYTITNDDLFRNRSHNQNTILIGFGAGLSYFVSDNASLDLNFGFAGWNNSIENTEMFNQNGDLTLDREIESNSLEFNFSMAQLFLGFSIYF